jgi:hypothetical protein
MLAACSAASCSDVALRSLANWHNSCTVLLCHSIVITNATNTMLTIVAKRHKHKPHSKRRILIAAALVEVCRVQH